MTTKEFWDSYINDDILDIFDDTCEFFSQELPEGFTDKYDPVDIILDTMGIHESAKNFGNVIKFIDIVKKHQPELYKETFIYLNDFLVEYYCFHQNTSKVEEAFLPYIGKPLQDYDKLLQSFKTIQYYQHTDLLNRAIDESYFTLSRSNIKFGGPFELASTKHFMILQDVFEKNKGAIDKNDLLAKLEEFDFGVNDITLSLIHESLTQSQLGVKELKSMFVKDKGMGSMVLLRGYFLRYMYERGFQFYVSGHIWDKMLELWEENTKVTTFDDYFRVTTDSFEEYLLDFSTGFVGDKPEMIATLWGSVYIYEFLHKVEIISTKVYQDFLKTSQKMKGSFIGIFTHDLWRSNFVHHWQKPDSVSEDEFREEHNIFNKSLYFKRNDFDKINHFMSEELEKIGPLADYIIESAAIKESQDFGFFNNQMKDNAERYEDDDDDDDDDEYLYYEDKRLEPIRTEPKVGRNDPCTCGSGKKYKKCCGKG